MSYKEAIEYLRPVADNHPVARYSAALEAAIRALEEVDTLRAELADERYRFERYADFSVAQSRMIDQLKEDLQQSGRHEPCDYCKHNEAWFAYCTRDSMCDECLNCECPCNNCQEFSKWEWRGTPEVQK